MLTEIHICTLHAFTSPSCVKSSCGSFRCAFRHSMFIGGLKSTNARRKMTLLFLLLLLV